MIDEKKDGVEYWQCKACTSYNKPSHSTCSVCKTVDKERIMALRGSNNNDSNVINWSCSKCTFLNLKQKYRCEICSNTNPNARSAKRNRDNITNYNTNDRNYSFNTEHKTNTELSIVTDYNDNNNNNDEIYKEFYESCRKGRMKFIYQFKIDHEKAFDSNPEHYHEILGRGVLEGIMYDRVKVLKFLYDWDNELDLTVCKKEDDGITCLHECGNWNAVGCLYLIIQWLAKRKKVFKDRKGQVNFKRININQPNAAGKTILHEACYHNNPRIIALLLEHTNIRIDYVDGDNKTPEMACSCDKCLNVFIDYKKAISKKEPYKSGTVIDLSLKRYNYKMPTGLKSNGNVKISSQKKTNSGIKITSKSNIKIESKKKENGIKIDSSKNGIKIESNKMDIESKGNVKLKQD